jgi:hypothetical protein
MDDTESISLHTDTSPGLTAQEPMAFVVQCSDPDRIALQTADTADSSVDIQVPETRYGTRLSGPCLLWL